MATPNYFNAPIPGQSLTQDPTAGGPWENPPKYSTVNMALDHMFKVVTSKGFINHYDKLLKEDKKFYVDALVEGMLSEGFINGLWTVDVMQLMVEPMIVLMVWVAAQLNRSVSFTGDTGYEDRTGFGEMVDMILPEDEVPEGIPEPVTPDEPEALETEPLAPQSPLVMGGNI